MTAVGSFFHNPLYFERKRQGRNPLHPPIPTAWRYRGASGFPTSPFPELPMPTGGTASSSPWKENKIIFIYIVFFFLMGH